MFFSGPKVDVPKVPGLDGVQRFKHDIKKELGVQLGSMNTEKAINNLYRVLDAKRKKIRRNR